ncbi:hypothetical protein [Streptomyces sp. JJ36]|uniref:hypothetical protein n=1 Tax=Streptomyces sp. JJ36 TaxID=2736645 RepID=UPI001F2B2275|nr:hypothetical protein [Streptomyces sp. JJ36]MCF6522340.1 hypothetical protein [Streptomyces sp. JJ36]
MTENIEGALSPRSTLTEAEKSFVHKVAAHYHDTDGMEWERGYVIGWVIINYPAKQSAGDIAKALDIPRAPVDWIADLLTPPGVLIREDIPGGDDYYITLNDSAWPVAVEHSFRKIPNFHSVMRHGLEVLRDEPAERLERLVRMEQLYGVISKELDGVFDIFDEHRKEQAG